MALTAYETIWAVGTNLHYGDMYVNFKMASCCQKHGLVLVFLFYFTAFGTPKRSYQGGKRNRQSKSTGLSPNTQGTIEASKVVVLNEAMWLLFNENLCKQCDPHPQIEFDFDQKHMH